MRVRVEHLDEALGIGDRRPRLSWRLPDGTRQQHAYELRLDDGTTTSRVDSAECVLVAWPGRPLSSRERGAALQAVGSALRDEASLGDTEREIAILLVAASWDCEFERYAHEPIARAAGLSAYEVLALRAADVSVLSSPSDVVVAELVTALLSDGDLDDAGFEAAVDALGERKVFELMTLVGYYSTLALQLRVFRVDLPAGERLVRGQGRD